MEPYTTYQTSVSFNRGYKTLIFHTYLKEDSMCDIKVFTPSVETRQVLRGISCEECKTALDKILREAINSD